MIARVRMHMPGGSGGMLPQKIALTILLRPYLYPNTTSLTRVHGGVILPFTMMRCTSYRRIDDLDKNRLHFETSLAIAHCKSGHKDHHA